MRRKGQRDKSIILKNIEQVVDAPKKRDEPVKEEPVAEPEYCFPIFNFDGSYALKSKLVLNLRNC